MWNTHGSIAFTGLHLLHCWMAGALQRLMLLVVCCSTSHSPFSVSASDVTVLCSSITSMVSLRKGSYMRSRQGSIAFTGSTCSKWLAALFMA